MHCNVIRVGQKEFLASRCAKGYVSKAVSRSSSEAILRIFFLYECNTTLIGKTQARVYEKGGRATRHLNEMEEQQTVGGPYFSNVSLDESFCFVRLTD